MGIGFSFCGATRQKEQLIADVKVLAGRRGFETAAYGDGLLVRLCPLGELVFCWEKEETKPGWKIFGNCCSTPAGAGFHQAAIQFLDALGEQSLEGLTVEDETEFYSHRDFQKMKEEHFYPWLRTLTEVCEEQLSEAGYKNLCLCWDLDQYQPEDIPGTVVAPLGRFSVQKMVGLLKGQGVAALAELFFLWDQPQQDARYHRNRALKLLWEDCCFFPSTVSEEDRECNQAILDALELAARLDPALPLPLSAYQEVCALDGREPAIAGAAELDYGFPIGFRKGNVSYSLGDLRITMPGSFRYEWEENEDGGGCDLWYDPAVGSPILRVGGFRRNDGDAELRHDFKDARDVEELEIQGGKARWGWRPIEEEGEAFYQIYCEAATGPSLFMITVTYMEPEEREGIYGLLRKLSAVTGKPEEAKLAPCGKQE